MTEPHNPHLRAALMEVIENQLRDGAPMETRKTLARLMALGFTRERAMELIGCVLTAEMFDMQKAKETYNESRYLSRLQALPEMPWEG
jgi:rRNA processing protein Krr1/Pno1